nr:RNA polymerase sigma factor [Caudoviricetes sp.]
MTLEERNKKVEENLPLVTFSLNKLGVAFDEDYFQQGVLELIRCVDKFDEKKGIKFSTYAVKNIKLFLKEYIARDKVLRPKRTGIKGRVYAPPCDSFEKIVYNNGKAEEITLGDMIADDFQIENNTIMLDISILVSKKLISERDVNIFLDFHINKETKRSIGQKYGLSQRQITTILEKTKNDLQKHLSYNNN